MLTDLFQEDILTNSDHIIRLFSRYSVESIKMYVQLHNIEITNHLKLIAKVSY